MQRGGASSGYIGGGGVGGVGYGRSVGARMGPIAGTEAAEQLSRGPGVREWVGKPLG